MSKADNTWSNKWKKIPWADHENNKEKGTKAVQGLTRTLSSCNRNTAPHTAAGTPTALLHCMQTESSNTGRHPPTRCISSPEQTWNSSFVSCLKTHDAPPLFFNLTPQLTCKQKPSVFPRFVEGCGAHIWQPKCSMIKVNTLTGNQLRFHKTDRQTERKIDCKNP